MTIDRRLHHAARELRGVPIVVPPLGTTRRRQPARLLQAVAAPMLFVAGGMFAYGAAQATPASPVQSDVGLVTPVGVSSTAEATAATAVAEVAAATVAGSESGAVAPSVRAELEMIAELVSNSRPAVEVAPTATPDVNELPPASASTDAVGPI